MHLLSGSDPSPVEASIAPRRGRWFGLRRETQDEDTAGRTGPLQFQIGTQNARKLAAERKSQAGSVGLGR